MIDWPVERWAQQCHAVSIAIVRSDVLPRLGWPDRRVARGSCRGVLGQHSWIALGRDPYEITVPIVDPTLWSYRDDVDSIFVGFGDTYHHTPHGGTGTIWQYGAPPLPEREPIELPEAIMARLSP